MDVRVCRAVAQDIAEILPRVRSEDVAEQWAVNRKTVKQSLELGLRVSTKTWTVRFDNSPAIIAGVAPYPKEGRTGVAWAIGTTLLEKHPRILMELAPIYLRLAWVRYDRLANYVDARNRKAVRFLRWMGAEVQDPVLYGVEALPFHRFEFARPEHV